MNADVKTRWLAALRSGEYVQGRELLARRVGDAWTFCCLGVLCELAVADGVARRVRACACGLSDCGTGEEPDRHFYDGCDTVLPPSVARWAGLADDNPEVLGVPLSAYNDGQAEDGLGPLRGIDPHTFEEIARLIEEHL